MNKKIIIGVITLLFLAFVTAAIVAIKLKPSGSQNPANNKNSYNISVTEYQNTVTGSLVQNGKVTQLDENGVAAHALVSYNSTRDLLFIQCPRGYALTNPSSANGTQYVQDQITHSLNMELTSGQQNTVNFNCAVVN